MYRATCPGAGSFLFSVGVPSILPATIGFFIFPKGANFRRTEERLMFNSFAVARMLPPCFENTCSTSLDDILVMFSLENTFE